MPISIDERLRKDICGPFESDRFSSCLTDKNIQDCWLLFSTESFLPKFVKSLPEIRTSAPAICSESGISLFPRIEIQIVFMMLNLLKSAKFV